MAWTVTLVGVPGSVTLDELHRAISLLADKPRHIELGVSSHQSSDAEVSVLVRSLLEEHGRVDSFHLDPASRGKRAKVLVTFRSDSEALSACCLTDEPLDILVPCAVTGGEAQTSRAHGEVADEVPDKTRQLNQGRE